MPDTPFISTIRAALTDSDASFGLIATVRVADKAAGDELEAILRRLVPQGRSEPGNIAYDANRDLADPARFVLYDRWETLEALAQHEQSPHFRACITRMNELFDSPPEITLFTPLE